MKTTLLGGVLALAPLVILFIILGKAFQISLLFAEPLDKLLGLETVLGVVTVYVLALLLIVGFCYLAGVLAQRAFLSGRMQKLENILIDFMPGYAAFRVVVGSMSAKEDLEAHMTPVMVRFDDYDQIAFQIEKSDDHAVIYLPGTPSAWSGSSIMVAADRVTPLDIPAHHVVRTMRVFGRGALAARAGKETVG